MKTILWCCSLFLLASCLDETKVDPATPETFVRYINGGNHDVAQAMETVAPGEYIILANTGREAVDVKGLIKLVKVNAYGSVVWSKILPDTASAAGAVYKGVDVRGKGISVTDTGYIISGEVIHDDGKSDFFLLETDLNGEPKKYTSLDFPKVPRTIEDAISITGQAARKLGDDNVLVLASVTGFNQNMILANINTASPPSIEWHWTYGSSASTIMNKMFIDKQNDVVFGGTVTRDNGTDLRLVKALQNNQGTDFDLPFGEPGLSERANGMCKTLNGYAMVGSTDVARKQDRDILFTRFSESGALLASRTYPMYYPNSDTTVAEAEVLQNEEGNAICTTTDSGFIVLATITSSTGQVGDPLGRGERDYCLIKLNAFGDVEWFRVFGSKRDDIGVSVSQAEDGGYLIVGSTFLANLWTVALIKTNSLGEIE